MSDYKFPITKELSTKFSELSTQTEMDLKEFIKFLVNDRYYLTEIKDLYNSTLDKYFILKTILPNFETFINNIIKE